MPTIVSISGIDGCGKSTTNLPTIDHYDSQGLRVVKFGTPIFMQEGGDRTYFGRGFSSCIDSAHAHFDKKDARRKVGVINTGYCLAHSIIRQYVLRRYKPDLVINGRDQVLDSAVYSNFYFGSTRHFKPAGKLQLYRSILHEDYPDLLIFMNVSTKTALSRIQKRLDEESTGVRKTLREKFVHMHETADNLELLRGWFYQHLYELHKMGVNVRIIDAEQPKEIVNAQVIASIDDIL
jgi:thymidylate kinase